jgi:hypothetical protein
MTMGKRSAARERHPAALDGESGTGRVRAARGRVGTRGRQGTIDRSFFSWEKKYRVSFGWPSLACLVSWCSTNARSIEDAAIRISILHVFCLLVF